NRDSPSGRRGEDFLPEQNRRNRALAGDVRTRGDNQPGRDSSGSPEPIRREEEGASSDVRGTRKPEVHARRKGHRPERIHEEYPEGNGANDGRQGNVSRRSPEGAGLRRDGAVGVRQQRGNRIRGLEPDAWGNGMNRVRDFFHLVYWMFRLLIWCAWDEARRWWERRRRIDETKETKE